MWWQREEKYAILIVRKKSNDRSEKCCQWNEYTSSNTSTRTRANQLMIPFRNQNITNYSVISGLPRDLIGDCGSSP